MKGNVPCDRPAMTSVSENTVLIKQGEQSGLCPRFRQNQYYSCYQDDRFLIC